MVPRMVVVALALALLISVALSKHTVRTMPLPDAAVGVSSPSFLVNSVGDKVLVGGRGGPKVLLLDGRSGEVLRGVAVGGYADKALLNGEAGKLYVFRRNGRVAVLDAVRDTVLGSVPTGEVRHVATVYARGLNRVYASQEGGGEIYVLRGDNDTLCTSLTLPASTVALAYSPHERKVYCAFDFVDSVAVIDAVADTVLGFIAMPQQLSLPSGACYNEVSNTVYIGDSNGRVFVIDCAGDSLLATVETDRGYIYLMSAPVLGRTYAFSYDQSGVTSLDSRTHVIRSRIPTSTHPASYAYDEPGNRLYVLSEWYWTDLSEVTVIDCTADTVLRRFPVGFQGGAVCLADSGRRLFVASPLKDEVSVFDTGTDSLLARLPTAFAPRCGAYSPRLGRVLWASSSCDRYAIIDVASDSMLALLPARMGTHSACLAPNLDKVFLSNDRFCDTPDTFVTAVDLAQCRETEQIRLGYMPMQQSYYESTSTLYVASGNSRVYAIDAVRDSVLRWGFTTVQPHAFGCNTATGRLYVTAQEDKGLVVLDGTTFNVVAALKKGCSEGELGFAPDVNKVYFGYADSVVVIDGSADTVLAELPSPGWYPTFCYNPRLHLMYCLDDWGGRLNTIDVLSDSTVSTLPTGCLISATRMAVDESGLYLYVTDAARDRLLVISGDGREIVDVVEVGDYPLAVIAASPGTAVVGNNRGSSLSVVSMPSGVATGELQPSRPTVPTFVRTIGQLTRGIGDVELFDAAGRRVVDATALAGLKAGVYFWRATEGGATGGKVVVVR